MMEETQVTNNRMLKHVLLLFILIQNQIFVNVFFFVFGIDYESSAFQGLIMKRKGKYNPMSKLT